MNIKIKFKGVDELEEFFNTHEPEPITINGVSMLYIHCDGIDTEWYIPLYNVLWYSEL